MIDEQVERWLEGDYDEETKAEIRRLAEEDPQALQDAFYTTLKFGTGGLRGLMGVGTNRMNVYTVREATQGLANYLNKETKNPSILIGYDSRLQSREFAEEAAKVMTGNGISVHMFKELCPTPIVSFGCRHLKCSAAIMVTASHNPPEYNGYKVYWSHGGQVLPPHDVGIVEEVNKVKEIKLGSLDDVEWITTAIDDAYIKATQALQNYPEQNKRDGAKLRVVYSSLHGTGATITPRSMQDWGFTDVHLVEEQCKPDGLFPTINNPNPEDPEAMTLCIALLDQIDGDILIATDGDADRVGIAVRHQGKTHLLNGNQIACVLIAHICEAMKQQNAFPENPAFIKTIVTSELFRKIAESYDCACFDVLTGFKYIGQLITKWEEEGGPSYIFGGEESYGYLLGTHTRDKDGIAPSSLLCEAALHAKLAGKTLIDRLDEIYEKYGLYREELASLSFPGKEGAEKMAALMEKMRREPPQSFGGIAVELIEDYKTSERKEIATNQTSPIDLPSSNVLAFTLADQTRLVIRPSGTEPKIKLYVAVVHDDAESHMQLMLNDLKSHLS